MTARRIAQAANAIALGYLLGARWPSNIGRGAAILTAIAAGITLFREQQP